MKILAFGASTSSTSINRQLAGYAASLVEGAEVTNLDLRQFDLPMYSSDEEEQNGIPAAAKSFKDMIINHDAVVVSLAEHNGSYSAAFKNLYDWTSRIDPEVWAGKPMLLLSTSPGGRGAASVMEAAKEKFPRMGADLKATFSLPAFYDNFVEGKITDPALADQLEQAVKSLTAN
ncbi:MAG: NAD(P)H-dependent oxidoreductase [Verrucomicrobiales bacterium]|nr:NAD(P)H-dependent oxidoreductase [Verrucomicrobiales bacterium]